MAAKAKKKSTKSGKTPSKKSTKLSSSVKTASAKRPGLQLGTQKFFKAAGKNKYLSFVLILVVVLLGLFVYFARSLFVVAMVNGTPIYRLTVVKQLEKFGGRQILDELINRELVAQELQRQGITISDEDVNNEISMAAEQIESQGLTLEEALAQDNLTMEDLFIITKHQKSVEALVQNESVEVTDEEIQAFYENNEAFFPDQELDKVRDQIADTLMQQKIQTGAQALLARLRQEANIVNLYEY